MPDARWLDRDALAAHICVRPDAIARLVKAGRLPAASYHLGPRQPRWDREKVDAKFSGGLASTDPGILVQAAIHEIIREGRARR